ncbi:hypothetical protein CAI21_13385 [Alkalilimnicola ehrlichii]|uniref:Glutaredoxin 2 n=1 Tax=Alkalilimnicola ehrlichii TaxID=351052 RepID=A0A3E0WGT7_9GAMM|nr:glutaredoxin family protein [Alkalilimnicola ehrlichii]RFA28321.1 hypothetical protein CAI21_13385 [Alkalilimnicola ehrlichii]RFA31659.1 hypothetical protein CAL65_21950 [Alkalilimnicola ehrlichii]
MTKQLILYGTDGCHLCEQARERVFEALGNSIDLVEVDILDDEQLEARYATSIPVLRSSIGEDELSWPFDIEQIQQLL